MTASGQVREKTSWSDHGAQASAGQRGSVFSRMASMQRADTQGSTLTGAVTANGDAGAAGEKAFPHPVEPRSRTAILPPVVVCTLRRRSCDASLRSWVMSDWTHRRGPRRARRSTHSRCVGWGLPKMPSSHAARLDTSGRGTGRRGPRRMRRRRRDEWRAVASRKVRPSAS